MHSRMNSLSLSLFLFTDLQLTFSQVQDAREGAVPPPGNLVS